MSEIDLRMVLGRIESALKLIAMLRAMELLGDRPGFDTSGLYDAIKEATEELAGLEPN